jgi:hypothetical protein
MSNMGALNKENKIVCVNPSQQVPDNMRRAISVPANCCDVIDQACLCRLAVGPAATCGRSAGSSSNDDGVK